MAVSPQEMVLSVVVMLNFYTTQPYLAQETEKEVNGIF